MATNYTGNVLDRITDAFSVGSNRCSKLNEFIVALQGSGNHTVNGIVNDMVFLRRELMGDTPNEVAVKQVLRRIHKRTQTALKDAPAQSATLKQVHQTLRSIK